MYNTRSKKKKGKRDVKGKRKRAVDKGGRNNPSVKTKLPFARCIVQAAISVAIVSSEYVVSTYLDTSQKYTNTKQPSKVTLVRQPKTPSLSLSLCISVSSPAASSNVHKRQLCKARGFHKRHCSPIKQKRRSVIVANYP